MAKNAVKIVTDAILGKEMRVVSLNGKTYQITPPTIWKISGAASRLSWIPQTKDVKELIEHQALKEAAGALSWLVKGDESLEKEFLDCTPEEVLRALFIAWEMVSVAPFLMLSALAKSVSSLTAKQKL